MSSYKEYLNEGTGVYIKRATKGNLNKWESNAGLRPSKILAHKYLGFDKNANHRFAVLVEDTDDEGYIIGDMVVFIGSDAQVHADYQGNPISMHINKADAQAALKKLK